MLSLGRIYTIARVTFLESIRQQVLSVLLIVSLAMAVSSAFFSVTGFVLPDQQIKFIKDADTGIMTWAGTVIAILSASMLIPQEIENRTIYTILAKPVRRAEFLLGKYMGVIFLLTFATVLLSLVFELSLRAQEARSLADVDSTYDRVPPEQQNPDYKNAHAKDRQEVIDQVEDPQLINAILLIYAQLVVVATMTLFLSTFATSFLFTIVVTVMLIVIGELEGIARQIWLGGQIANPVASYFLGLVTLMVPDFSTYTIIDEIMLGNKVPFSHIENILGYSAVYVVVLLFASEMIFRNREI